MAGKEGIRIEIPGFGDLHITTMVTDYTGTHACGGVLVPGVKERLLRLSEVVDIHVLTSDTFGTVERELQGIPHVLKLLDGDEHDAQKEEYIADLEKVEDADFVAFGNGNNDRRMLECVRNIGGVAIAVDNGEGCAVDVIQAANLFIHGSVNALDLLLDPRRLIATLRS